VVGKYNGLDFITVGSSLTCLLARVPSHCVPLLTFHLPWFLSASGEATTCTGHHTTRRSVGENATGIFGGSSEGASLFLGFLLVSIEGICGGLALYVIILHFFHLLMLTPTILIRSVNVFYRINREKSDSSDPETAKQDKEFKIGSMGVPCSQRHLLCRCMCKASQHLPLLT